MRTTAEPTELVVGQQYRLASEGLVLQLLGDKGTYLPCRVIKGAKPGLEGNWHRAFLADKFSSVGEA